MGKEWDGGDIAFRKETWELALQLLKPGGHLLAFSGSRTYHRMAVAIEDAGFEIRDQIMWLYGSGFPKSHNISKAIDKAAGAEREVVGYYDRRSQHDGSDRTSEGDTGDSQCAGRDTEVEVTKPATPEAEQWEGFGTALKPAHEPIVMARKPLSEDTIVKNVLEHGTGAINIDDCRVKTGDIIEQSGELEDLPRSSINEGYDRPNATMFRTGKPKERSGPANESGRWPANVIHDGSEEVLDEFAKYGDRKSGSVKEGTVQGFGTGGADIYGDSNGVTTERHASSGSAARFFYSAKVSKQERNHGLKVDNTSTNKRPVGQAFGDGSVFEDNQTRGGNVHPTVKNVELMKYLCRLVTPPEGTVMDIFMGSGSTGMGARIEGFSFIGIEREKEYFDIATQRIDAALTLGNDVEAKKQKIEQDFKVNPLFRKR